MVHSVKTKSGKYAMVYNKEGLTVFTLRNRQWRLDQFIVFGIGGKTRNAAMDGFKDPLNHEEAMILNGLYKIFSRWYSVQRILHRRKAGYLSEDQRKACCKRNA